MKHFKEYKKILKNGKHYKTEFELHNTSLYISNSLRRSFSSLLLSLLLLELGYKYCNADIIIYEEIIKFLRL